MTDHNAPVDKRALMAAKFKHYALLVGMSIVCSLYVVVRTLVMIVRKGTDSVMHKKERSEKPAVLRDPTFAHGTLQLSELSLHYAHTGDRSKPLMLFLHGFPEFWYSWRHQLREFSPDYWCVAVDMRGYGESDAPSGISHYTVDRLTADIKETVTALGKDSCVLVGHDWGAIVAWSTAIKHPAIVERLVVMNAPHPHVFHARLRESTTQLVKSWYMFYFQCPLLPEFVLSLDDFGGLNEFLRDKPKGVKLQHNMSDADLDAWKYAFAKSGFTGGLNVYRASMREYRPPATLASPSKVSVTTWEMYMTFSKVSMPVLILWGTEDAFLETAMADMSTKHCQEATLQLVHGASHWVQQDHPDVVNGYMREFLMK